MCRAYAAKHNWLMINNNRKWQIGFGYLFTLFFAFLLALFFSPNTDCLSLARPRPRPRKKGTLSPPYLTPSSPHQPHPQLFSTKEIKLFTLVKLGDYQINHIGLRKVLIILNLTPVSHAHAQIGILQGWPEDGAVGGGDVMMQTSAPAAAPVAAAAGAGAGYGGGGGGYGGGAAVARPSPAAGSYMPISQLNPYNNRWTIKVRVTSKGDIRKWNNERSSGQLFKLELLDEHGGEMSAAFFKEAVDKYYEQIHVGHVYLMSGGRVKLADKKFSAGREYEINFDEKASISQCDDDVRIKSVMYNIVSINDLTGLPEKSNVDVMGVIKSVNDVMEIQSKLTNKTLLKRDISMFDDSGMAVDCTLWGESARTFVGAPGNIVGLKNAQLSNWNGRSISTGNTTNIEIEPTHERADQLRSWYAANPGGATGTVSERGQGGGGGGAVSAETLAALTDIAKRKPISALTESNARDSGEEQCVVRSTVEIFRTDKPLWYPACKASRNDRQCQKKLTDNGGGAWICGECGHQDAPEYRYILPVRLYDTSSSTIATLFNAEVSMRERI